MAEEVDDWTAVSASAPADDWAPVEAPRAAGPGFIQSIKDTVEPMLKAFGHGFSEGFGPERLGMSEADTRALSKAGLYAPEGATSYSNPFHAMNELLGETIYTGGQIIFRGGAGLFRGAQAAGMEAGLPRDIVAMPEAFFGSPHPTGMPSASVARVARQNAIQELAAGERPATMADLARARELKVIDPEQPRVADLPPAEAAAKAIQPTVAYHGSPHDFAAFSMEKIGTGEGAQSYGRGLYFAEHPDVAKDYAQRLGTPRTGGAMSSAGMSFKDLDEAAGKNAVVYQVRIHADREAFLDLDKRLNEQAPEIQAAVKRAMGIDYEGKFDQAKSDRIWNEFQASNGKVAVRQGFIAFDDAVVSERLREAGVPGLKYLDQGSRAIEAPEKIAARLEDISQRTSEIEALPEEARAPKILTEHEALAQERQQLRTELEQHRKDNATRNFVVFSDKDVEITHKNGEPVEPQMSSRAMAAEHTGDDVLKGPKPGEPATGNPWQDRFDKFVGKLNTPEDVQNLIRDAARENDGFVEARAGDVPLGHVESLAEAAGVAADTIDPRGIGRVMKNDNEVRIGMQTMLQTTENVREAARELRANDTPENAIKLQEAMMRRDLAVEQIVGLRAEWGRTGGVFQEFLRDVKDAESLDSFLKDKGRSRTDLRDIADALDKLDGTGAARVLSDMHSKRPNVFYWTWINGLISGLLTHTKYVAANALYAASEHGVVTPIAAAIGNLKRVFGPEVERVYFGEAMAATYGMIGAVPEAIFATGKSMWEGKRAVLKSEIELHKEAVARGDKVPPIIDRAVNQLSGAGRPEFFGDNSNVWGRLTAGDIPGAAKDALGRAIGSPGDMAMGIHSFFKILGERAGIHARNYRNAIKEGLSPADGDFWRRYSELNENPSLETREGSVVDAYKGTFMNELGPRGRDWQKFTKNNAVARWIFPFSHIPINLMKATYEATPLAVLDSEMRASITGKNGGVAQDRAIARMIAGSAIMGYFTHQAMNGRVTGDYPHDPQERDAWKLQGKQPNSILIGGYWVSFGKFGPAGNLANLGANIAAVIHHLESKDDDAMSKATFHAAAAAGHLIVDEVGFQSLQNMFEAYHDDKKGAAWVASTAASFVPFSSLLGQTASGGVPFTGGWLGDPHMREAKTIIDGIKSKIPGQRETLLPKRDWLGQPMPNPQYGNILRQKQALTDPVSMEMDRLQIHPGLPQDRIGGVKLTRPLYDEFQTIAGAYTKTALESLVNAPGWMDIPTAARIGAIHANIKSSRQIAESMMQIKHPELIGQGMQQRIDFITGKSLTARPKKAPEPAAVP